MELLNELETVKLESPAAPVAVVCNVIKLFLDVGGIPARTACHY
jgi:hypothetical protein